MQLEENDLICQIKWVRYGNNEPLIYETINLNYKLSRWNRDKRAY